MLFAEYKITKKRNHMKIFIYLALMLNLGACASFKSQEERHIDSKATLKQFIELVKKGNLPKARELFYENTTCYNDEERGCYRYIFKGENRRFRASDSYGFDSLVNHIQVVAACSSSKNVKDLESCVRRQKKGIYVDFILPEISSNNDETEFDVKRFCEIGLGGMTTNPEHNDLFRAIGWSDFTSIDEAICEVQ